MKQIGLGLNLSFCPGESASMHQGVRESHIVFDKNSCGGFEFLNPSSSAPHLALERLGLIRRLVALWYGFTRLFKCLAATA
jgi:hypothetical protein